MGYRFSASGATWETAEVTRISAGESVLFSPVWFHRVVPQASQATHAAVTLVATWQEAGMTSRARRPGDASVPFPQTGMHVCWSVRNLIKALRDPGINLSAGLPWPPCTAPQ